MQPQTGRQQSGDHPGGQLIVAGKPYFPIFIFFADNGGPFLRRHIKQLPLNLRFHHLAFLFDDDDFFQTVDEFFGEFRLKRPGHRHFANPKSNPLGGAFINVEIGKCLHQIVIGFAGGEDADTGSLAVECDAVQLVLAGEGPSSTRAITLYQAF